jgi:homoserine O-succinyltransferase
MSGHSIKVAILDMYDGEPNQGMRCILDIVNRFHNFISLKVFDVRGKNELPDIKKYDIYISTGGPGNPTEGDGIWDKAFYKLIDDLLEWNSGNDIKKHVLFICHSFQMACLHFRLAEVTKRNSTSFGIMPVHKTTAGQFDPFLDGLSNPFYAIDSRDYQVVQPNLKVFERHGASILSLEKIRDHVKYERAIMAVRFNDYFVGTQFHPEADPISYVVTLKDAEKRAKIVALKGKTKFRDMLEDLLDADKIYKTNETVIPNFLRLAINDLIKTRKILLN